MSSFFIKHKEIKVDDFFKAPYFVYPEGQTFDLKFFTTQKAISVYKIYQDSKKTG